MRKILISLICALTTTSAFSQNTSDLDQLVALRKLEQKYNGEKIIELENGITLKADMITEEHGCLFIAFKGKYSEDEKKFEDLTVIPLTEIKNINNDPVNKFHANVALCDFYLTKMINIAEAEKFLLNAQEIFKSNGSPEQHTQVIEDLKDKLKAIKNKDL